MKEQIAQLLAGMDTCYPNDLIETLSKSGSTPLTIKFGADPSAPDLHLGHMVVLNKLAILQQMGHHVLFLIGDFTAMIGDPTGKSETRKPLTQADVSTYSETYQAQVFRILDPKKTTVVFNSAWLNVLSPQELITLSAKYTVARMLERDDFSKRFKGEKSISIHEFLYPLLQGYDSVHLKNDIEIGGTDQTFNLLMGRHLQKEYGVKPQGVITVPILEGLDGTKKMSKSLKNHIALMDTPNDIFGKCMSIPDTLIIRYFRLLTDVSPSNIDAIEDGMASGDNPKNAKVRLAKTLIARLHSNAEADKAEAEFNRIFSQKERPTAIPEISLNAPIRLDECLVRHQMAASKKDAVRLIKQGAVNLNGEKIKDPFYIIDPPADNEHILNAGKRRWLKIISV